MRKTTLAAKLGATAGCYVYQKHVVSKQITKISLVSFYNGRKTVKSFFWRFLFTQRVLKSNILKWRCVLLSFPLFVEGKVSLGSVSCVLKQHCQALALWGVFPPVGWCPPVPTLAVVAAPPAPVGTLHSDTPAQAAVLLFYHVALCFLTNMWFFHQRTQVCARSFSCSLPEACIHFLFHWGNFIHCLYGVGKMLFWLQGRVLLP